jgi:pimeloyl-ACP methyl ester carboxylesterase
LISRISVALGLFVVHTWFAFTACAQEPRAWQDPSKHQVRFITVDEGVQLEVLDWGGSGRAVVLLTGSGNTAHVFDDFAPKLRDCCRVYGITRRGFGSSSRPATGYDDQRLAEDILTVLNALHLDQPVLAGHSMAGGELTTIGRQHSRRISGLVYLDATADPGDPSMSDPDFVEATKKLPEGMRQPPVLDRSSFAAYQASQRRANLGVFPESELRQGFAERQDGSLGQYTGSTEVINAAIGRGQIKRDYAGIRVPVLVFIDYPAASGDGLGQSAYQPLNDMERAAMAAYDRVVAKRIDKRIDNLTRSVPTARVVKLPGASHYGFLTRETEVLAEMYRFVGALK